MAQIANPYSGSNALYMGMVNQLNNNDIGGSIANLGQTINAGKLSELMAQNGGNVTQSMAPLAMLATPEANKQFNTSQALQRTDRGLDQYDTQLDISQQNADTNKYNADTSRFNYNLNNKKYGDTLKGTNQLYDYLSDVNGMETNGSQDPNLMSTIPGSTAKGPWQMNKPTAQLIANKTGKPLDWLYNTKEGQFFAVNELTKHNAKSLAALGMPVNNATLKAAHQLGITDLQKLASGKYTQADIDKWNKNLPGWQKKYGNLFGKTPVPPRPEGQQIYPETLKYIKGQTQADNTQRRGFENKLFDFSTELATKQAANGTKILANMGKNELNRLKTLISGATNTADRNKLLDQYYKVANTFGISGESFDGTLDPTVNTRNMENAAMQETTKAIADIKNPAMKQTAVAIADKNGGKLTPDQLELANRGDLYNTDAPAEIRAEKAREITDFLRDRGDDIAAFEGLPFRNDDKRWDNITKALALTLTKSDIARINKDNPNSLIDSFKKIGFDYNPKNTIGRNITPTPNMARIIAAKKANDKINAELATALAENDMEKVRDLMVYADEYNRNTKTIEASPYIKSAIDAAMEMSEFTPVR